MNLRRSWRLLAIVFAAACGDVDEDVEDRLTITQGVYGQTTLRDDVGDNPREAIEMTLTVSAGTLDANTKLGDVTSGDQGFYEYPLDAGDYVICTSFQRCTTFSVAAAQRVRLDYRLDDSWFPR